VEIADSGDVITRWRIGETLAIAINGAIVETTKE
jgi:hypothetical protein